MFIFRNLNKIKSELPAHVTLVAVSKTMPVADIQKAFEAGQRDFGENKVQEMVEKYDALPKDICWHMIGHLQKNKVKYMAHFVHLIHGVDSLELLKEIDKQANKHNRIIHCLLQVYIAQEETKFGLTQDEVLEIINSNGFKDLKNIKIVGLMGMASNTENEEQIKLEFSNLNNFYQKLKQEKPETLNNVLRHFASLNLKLETLSMGMSGDYKIAIREGSNMVRIGSAIFGSRNYIAL
jgi:pyridoxal phosphate enzyme (YggS family)